MAKIKQGYIVVPADPKTSEPEHILIPNTSSSAVKDLVKNQPLSNSLANLDRSIGLLLFDRFSQSKDYKEGDVVIFEDNLYKFKKAYSGPWNLEYVQATNIYALLGMRIDSLDAEVDAQGVSNKEYVDGQVTRLTNLINATQGGISGFAPNTDYNPNIPVDKQATVIAGSQGTYTNFKDVNGQPITITEPVSFTIFFKAAGVTYWDYQNIPITLDIAQELGDSTTKVMSQFGITKTLEKDYAKVVQSSNILNMENKIAGQIASSPVGYPQKIDASSAISTEKVTIEGLSQVTFKGVRIYSITDINGIVIKKYELISSKNTYTIDIPKNAYYLWVSTYLEEFNQQINIGNILLPYEPYSFDFIYKGASFNKLASTEIETKSFSVDFKFERGTISGSAESIQPSLDSSRARGYIIPIKGAKYTLNNDLQEKYKILARFKEHLDGSLTAFNNDTLLIKDYKKIWVVIGKQDSSNFNIDEYESIHMSATYKENLYDYTVRETSNEDCLQDIEENNNNDILTKEKLESENSILKKEIELLNKNISGVRQIKFLQDNDSQVIHLKHNNGGKLILGLHKRVNDGYATDNDAYLPKSQNNFSDVRIVDDKGNTLPYRTIYKGNIDILPDDRVPHAIIHTDTEKNPYGVDKIDRKIYRFSNNFLNKEPLSVFTDLYKPAIAWISEKTNTIFVGSKGKLYRSEFPYTEKTMVLDENLNHQGSTILSHSMTQHPITGDLFIGSYQPEFDCMLFKSIDDGKTWNLVYRNKNYQHIHNMSRDIYQNPPAIYAGLDGGGGIAKSIDSGENWVEIRAEHPDIPQSTDYGITYSDASGYRLSGGETSIVGGYSILKTTDDVTFKPVLGCSQGVYKIKKLGGKLFAGVIASNNFDTGAIIMSDDDGETWKTVYITGIYNGGGASDGFRYLSADTYNGCTDRQIIAGSQSGKHNLRILDGGDNYYSQIIVEIPNGCSSITVEDGYIMPYEKDIINTSISKNKILDVPLNTKADIIQYSCNGVTKNVRKKGGYIYGGKHLGNIYPHIESVENVVSLIDYDFYIKENLDLSKSNFHIGFWIYSYTKKKIYLLSNNNFEISLDEGIININHEEIYNILFPRTDDNFVRIDLNFTPDFKLQGFINGKKASMNKDITQLLPFMKDEIYFLTKEINQHSSYGDENIAIQFFEVTNGNVSEEEAVNNYYDGLFDNM